MRQMSISCITGRTVLDDMGLGAGSGTLQIKALAQCPWGRLKLPSCFCKQKEHGPKSVSDFHRTLLRLCLPGFEHRLGCDTVLAGQ